MSDHVDGPRSIGDPAADLTDLFAFTNPDKPAVMGASRGMTGTARGQAQLRQAFVATNTYALLQPEVLVDRGSRGGIGCGSPTICS